jgi:hypothetical protein
LDELFSRDPLKLGDADLDKIIDYFREKRQAWVASENAPKPPKGVVKASKSKDDAVDLGDLGL